MLKIAGGIKRERFAADLQIAAVRASRALTGPSQLQRAAHRED